MTSKGVLMDRTIFLLIKKARERAAWLRTPILESVPTPEPGTDTPCQHEGGSDLRGSDLLIRLADALEGSLLT